MKKLSIITLVSLSVNVAFAQKKATYTPKIEPCPCAFKADSSLKTICGYLIVPENRNKPNGKTIKLPYIIAESNNPNKKKDPVLFTGGGPGASSLGFIRSVHNRSLIRDRDFITFEQRGTHFAVPNLNCNDIGEALKKAFIYNLPKDSMILVGVKQCRAKLVAQGIDLAGYNTVESAADIEDLRKVLKIDSLNLFGASYSGGLMPTVLKNHPDGIRSLILDSPLPEFVNIDEEELVNFNEALNTVLTKYEADTIAKLPYGKLKDKFKQYFTGITGKDFTIKYLPKDAKDSLTIHYSQGELIGYLLDVLYDFSRIKDIPFIVSEMIQGRHQLYIKSFLDGIFRNGGPSGMRLSVYCSDKMAFARDVVIKQQYQLYPYMAGAGYYVNDVYRSMCDCWKVPPIVDETKMPFYSKVPVLLGGGDTDPATRPIYNDMMHHFMPNSQRVLFKGRSHCPTMRGDGDSFISQFLNNPYKKVVSTNKDIIVY
ncbi:alpha/beta fold hydrolase [Emticicia sp. C21]|uniref:alpha/beta fold hydrolase n=1 Tax=Emticicia sp. C21 TaxID=2302915 RepID=UPI000E343C12|nr:alpha/beta hydrolase [Emticicia sp. C21]RFS15645.1 alpha/beta fold hydrolase [Emticicia sp. C21]